MFTPGFPNPLHTHTNEVRIVVLQGAYIYKPQNGNERRVGAGSYISIPGGDVHVSRGDPKERALFYEESPGQFDLKVVDQKGKKYRVCYRCEFRVPRSLVIEQHERLPERSTQTRARAALAAHRERLTRISPSREVSCQRSHIHYRS